jgi:hypothetical protein
VIHSAGNAGNINKISHDLECFLSQVELEVGAGWGPPLRRARVVTFNAGIHDLAGGQVGEPASLKRPVDQISQSQSHSQID